MLIIRFQRVGRKNDPAFRLVVTEHQNRPQGKHLEVLGSYHPKTKYTVLKQERIQHWLSKGAKLSDTAHNLLIKNKVISAKTRPVVRARAKTEAAA
ncbi:MAG: 30S ribosomal protein S16 [Candidatus Sungbacteria bacterium]|nr:30S ribosomal protein S16 [Candidatus Sungbacteria bacterium]